TRSVQSRASLKLLEDFCRGVVVKDLGTGGNSGELEIAVCGNFESLKVLTLYFIKNFFLNANAIP
ncbi:MAG: hypothetical protein ACPGWR_11930, partial [Ardenticatenaceae bacterium]